MMGEQSVFLNAGEWLSSILFSFFLFLFFFPSLFSVVFQKASLRLNSPHVGSLKRIADGPMADGRVGATGKGAATDCSHSHSVERSARGQACGRSPE